MSTRAMVLVGTVAAVAAWWWFVRCARACVAAEHAAQDLFRRGEPLSALALIDAVDARCRCARFTSGDAPPQYALARACLRQLSEQGRSTEVEHFLAHARAPILADLTKNLEDPTPPRD